MVLEECEAGARRVTPHGEYLVAGGWQEDDRRMTGGWPEDGRRISGWEKMTGENGGRFWYRAVFLVLAHEAGSAFFVARTCDLQMLTFWEKGSARRVLFKGF